MSKTTPRPKDEQAAKLATGTVEQQEFCSAFVKLRTRNAELFCFLLEAA